MVGQHLYAYYSAGNYTKFHIGRLDTLTGTWESSTKTMVTQPGSMVVPFNFSSTGVKSEGQAQEQDQENQQHQQRVRKPLPSHPHQLDHLKGFLVLTPYQGVIVRTLGDFDREERTIGHNALLQTMEPPVEERPALLEEEENVGEDEEPGENQQHQQQERDNEELRNFPELNQLMAILGGGVGGGGHPPNEAQERILALLHRGHDRHRLVDQLHAQLAMHAVTIKWLAAAVDAPARAIYAQAEVSFGQERLLSQMSFFRLNLSGTPEAIEQPWRRLDVPGAEAIPAAAVMAVHDGHLYLLERVERAAAVAINNNGNAAAPPAMPAVQPQLVNGCLNAPRRFDVHHVVSRVLLCFLDI